MTLTNMFMKSYAHFYKQFVKLAKVSAGEWEWIGVYPLVHIFSIGFLVMFLEGIGTNKNAAIYMLVGAFAWNFYVLCQRGITYGILPEIWSDSAKHLIISPSTVKDFILGNGTSGTFSALISVFIMHIVASAVFSFNIFNAGPALILALAGLMLYGLAEGLVINAAMMLKGPEYMNLTWIITGIVMVLSAVYYPLELLPKEVRLISNLLPTTYAIQSIRTVLVGTGNGIAEGLMSIGIGLVYLAIAALVFKWAIDKSRENGTILRL